MNRATYRNQLLLQAHGISPGPLDGLAGPKTLTALEQAQAAGIKLQPHMVEGWLEGCDQITAHDTRGQWRAPPTVLVIHYGAGTQASDVAVLTRKDAHYVSAHFSLARNGRVVQMVPLDRVALHAGDGHLDVPNNGRTLNYTAIGIELENFGWLDRSNDHEAWRAGTPRIPRSQCLEATHPLRGGDYFWPLYPEAQRRALRDLTRKILDIWPSITIAVGHDEVSAAKYDPGPAFNMARFRDHFGLAGPDATPQTAHPPHDIPTFPSHPETQRSLP